MSNELATKDEANIIPQQSPDRLIELAIEKGADVDQLGKLMDLQERWEKKIAEKEFNDALAKFQSDCPAIERNKKGHNCKYSSLSEIKNTIQPILVKHGLSYQFEIKDTQENIADEKTDVIQVTCIVKHIGGYSTKNSMKAYPDDSGSKNDIQSRGSAVTYLQRYTLIGALGITSADDDDDGNKADNGGSFLVKRHNTVLRDVFHSVYIIKQAIADKDLSTAAESWFELTDDEKQSLWLAPTKGGIFTTDERKIIHSQEFRVAYYGESAKGGGYEKAMSEE